MNMTSTSKCLIAASIVCASLAAAAQPREQIVKQLTHQADAWDKAIVRKDKPAIAANMSTDFRQIDGAGDIETKDSFVQSVLDPKLTINPYTVEDFEVRIYGDVALLSGRTRMTGDYEGKPFNSHYRYIDIYVRKAGVWRVASVQITKLKEQAR